MKLEISNRDLSFDEEWSTPRLHDFDEDHPIVKLLVLNEEEWKHSYAPSHVVLIHSDNTQVRYSLPVNACPTCGRS